MTRIFAFFFSWDDTYATELENFNDHKDEGEIWFGEDSLFRVIRWFERNQETIPTNASILDLGKLILARLLSPYFFGEAVSP